MTHEKVLVVPTALFRSRVTYAEKGLITEGIDGFAAWVAAHGEFIDRPAAEINPGYKQIIPYAVVRHADSYFLLQRKSAQSEQRLHHKYSIGVGGHINPSEITDNGDPVLDGLTRELNEELHIPPGYRERLVGLINDDTTDVGSVHLGMLFEIDSLSPDVSVRETHKMQGAWAPLGRVMQNYANLETWSQIVYDSYLYPRAAGDARAG